MIPRKDQQQLAFYAGQYRLLSPGAAMPKPKKVELSIVRLMAEMGACVDAWAAAHAVDRSEAILRLLELGLNAQAIAKPPSHHRDDLAIEAEAASRIGLLIDPETPQEERERRIHRLTEGPPEFVGFRIDLPGRRPN